MIYSVRHITRFRYKPAVRESIMELRLQPRTEGNQRCLDFDLKVKPAAVVTQYRDFLGNLVHHFDIAGKHTELIITTKSVVEVLPPAAISDKDSASWAQLDDAVEAGNFWEMLLPSDFARPTPLLSGLAHQLRIDRRATPLETLLYITHSIHEAFSYVPQSTTVDSPIDHALTERKGVCQDFAHIMIALCRGLNLPCRYVSGYLFYDSGDQATSSEGASHAWVEAFLPGQGWVGFDPTNDMRCGERHIRVAVGRDYAEVPPTRGVYKGGGESELSVSVNVSLSDAPTPEDGSALTIERRVQPPLVENSLAQQQQEQQQQQ
jgi:transglutaminase-like putative cysteine protease